MRDGGSRKQLSFRAKIDIAIINRSAGFVAKKIDKQISTLDFLDPFTTTLLSTQFTFAQGK